MLRRPRPCGSWRQCSERLRGSGMEGKTVIKEWERDPLTVARLDHDLARRFAATHLQLLCTGRVRDADSRDRRLNPAANRAVIETCREVRFGLHLVEQAIVAEIDFADVDAIVQRRDEEQQREQATARAGTAARANHHCDCAPSTICCTSLSSAAFRPTRSFGGS